jgi:threonine 3-dehydrogenase
MKDGPYYISKSDSNKGEIMRALLKPAAAPGALLTDVDLPRCGPADLLLRVRATSICGTDVHIWSWNDWARSTVKPPLVLGHEVAGEVVEIGRDVAGFRVGDTVSVESHLPCGDCAQCRDDRMHICDRLQILGVHRQGTFAEYLSIPAICAWKNAPGTPAEVASILEPLGNAVHAASEADVQDKKVVVFGCGPTGLFTVMAARAMGAASVFAVDVNRDRLAMAKALGADELFDGALPELSQRIARQAGGAGADAAFEMSGSPAAITDGLRSLRKGGTLIAFGLPKRAVEVDWSTDLILPGRRILGVVGRHMFRTWATMQRLLNEGKLDPRPVITHRYPLADFEQAFGALTSGTAGVGKAVMIP